MMSKNLIIQCSLPILRFCISWISLIHGTPMSPPNQHCPPPNTSTCSCCLVQWIKRDAATVCCHLGSVAGQEPLSEWWNSLAMRSFLRRSGVIIKDRAKTMCQSFSTAFFTPYSTFKFRKSVDFWRSYSKLSISSAFLCWHENGANSASREVGNTSLLGGSNFMSPRDREIRRLHCSTIPGNLWAASLFLLSDSILATAVSCIFLSRLMLSFLTRGASGSCCLSACCCVSACGCSGDPRVIQTVKKNQTQTLSEPQQLSES